VTQSYLQCAIGSHTLQRKDKGISIVPQGPQLISGLLGRQPAGDVGPNAAVGCHYFRLPGLRLASQLESITVLDDALNYYQLECGPMPNLMVALPNTGGALCSTPQSLADAHY